MACGHPSPARLSATGSLSAPPNPWTFTPRLSPTPSGPRISFFLKTASALSNPAKTPTSPSGIAISTQSPLTTSKISAANSRFSAAKSFTPLPEANKPQSHHLEPDRSILLSFFVRWSTIRPFARCDLSNLTGGARCLGFVLSGLYFSLLSFFLPQLRHSPAFRRALRWLWPVLFFPMAPANGSPTQGLPCAITVGSSCSSRRRTTASFLSRSEERRVGKECRSR